jgi:hypothetical protein
VSNRDTHTLATLRKGWARISKNFGNWAIDYEIFKKISFVINLFSAPNPHHQIPDFFEKSGISTLSNP